MKPDTRWRTWQHVKATLIKQTVIPHDVKVRSSLWAIDGLALTVKLSKFYSCCQVCRVNGKAYITEECLHQFRRELKDGIVQELWTGLGLGNQAGDIVSLTSSVWRQLNTKNAITLGILHTIAPLHRSRRALSLWTQRVKRKHLWT